MVVPRCTSPYFATPKPVGVVKMVPVPPADMLSMLLYRVANRDKNIRIEREWTKRGLSIRVNAAALKSFYAFKRRKRKPVTYEMRWEIAHAQKWKCTGCKKLLPLAAQVDHVVPLAHGGADTMTNMQMLCANCHAEKTRVEAKKGAAADRGIKKFAVPIPSSKT